MKKFSKKYLNIHSQGKSDKNGIFDVVTSFSIFDKCDSSREKGRVGCHIVKFTFSAF